jgi:hypothetical protein
MQDSALVNFVARRLGAHDRRDIPDWVPASEKKGGKGSDGYLSNRVFIYLSYIIPIVFRAGHPWHEQ